MPRVIHFELPVDDAERAAAFYRQALGWKIDKWEGPEPYWLVTTGEAPEPGIDGALTIRGEGSPGIVNIIGIDDLQAALLKVKAAGGTELFQSTVPGVGYLAYCLDTEGNMLGMMQDDPSADL
jgi:hypothetical protein